ncbi:MAG: NAD(P)/FAD-dependent oxidoreductase [Halobacteriota archaeon]
MRVVVLGAGYAGLTLARRLESNLPPDTDLVVVDERTTHLVQHEVHRVIRRPSIADAITVPLTEVLQWADVRQDRVVDVDVGDQRVTRASGEKLEYDYGAVCLGAETAYHDLPGVEAYGTPLKRLRDAERIRRDFLALCESGGTVVVGGAGLSGIQVAGELAALARELDATDRVRIRLLEQLSNVAPTFPSNFQAAVRSELEARNVDIWTGAAVQRATEETLELDAEDLSYDQLVWTGGIAGSPAMGGERPIVRSDLKFGDSTFVLGDAARIVDADGEAVPASASAAIRESKVVATNVLRLVRADSDGDVDFRPHPEKYRFEVPGWIVSVGDGAVAQIGATVLTGAAAKAMKASVGAGYLGSVGAIREAVELVETEFA